MFDDMFDIMFDRVRNEEKEEKIHSGTKPDWEEPSKFGAWLEQHWKSLSEFRDSYPEFFHGVFDLEILLNGEIVRAHESVVTRRNKVLRSMLESQKMESKLVLDHRRFLYSRKVFLEDISLDLLMVAEKYFETELKKICIDKLKDEISLENLLDTVQAATCCNSDELRTACQKFVVQNYTNMIGTPQLEALLPNTTFFSSLFKQADTVAKSYEDLSMTSAVHHFTLSGIDVVLEEGTKRAFPSVKFFAKGFEWSMEIFIEDTYLYLSLSSLELLKASIDKSICGEVQVTVFSNDPAFPDITVEDTNRYLGTHFLRIISRDYLRKAKKTYLKEEFFAFDISFKLLNDDLEYIPSIPKIPRIPENVCTNENF